MCLRYSRLAPYGRAHLLLAVAALKLMSSKVASLRSVPAGSSRHDIIEHHPIRCPAQILENFWPSKSSGDGSERVQLGLLIFFGQQQQTDEVHRFPINGVEIYRVFQSRQYSEG